MKLIILSFFLLALSCGSPKKPVNSNIKEASETKTEKPVEAPKIIKEELIVVLKYPNRMDDAKQLIENSGLTWSGVLFNQGATKIVLIKIPAEKRDFWIERLQQSGEFKSVELNGVATINNIKEKINNTFVSYRKTPCYGHCPTYNVRINKEGKVFYNGIKNILVKGKREFQLTDKQFSSLKDKLSRTSFSSYKSSYNNPRLMDIPSSYITYNKKEIQLRVWKEVPTELVVLTEYIEDILLEKKFYEL